MPAIQGEVHLALIKAEALVLFERLALAWERKSLAFEDVAEFHALFQLQAKLASLLAEQFLPNYRELVESARQQ